MKKKMSRIISLLLTLSIILGTSPGLLAYAAAEPETQTDPFKQMVDSYMSPDGVYGHRGAPDHNTPGSGAAQANAEPAHGEAAPAHEHDYGSVRPDDVNGDANTGNGESANNGSYDNNSDSGDIYADYVETLKTDRYIVKYRDKRKDAFERKVATRLETSIAVTSPVLDRET